MPQKEWNGITKKKKSIKKVQKINLGATPLVLRCRHDNTTLKEKKKRRKAFRIR